MPTNSPKVLVVGGAGYIGSHMILLLSRAGYQPVVLDNLSRGHQEAVLGAELIIGDMADKALLTQVFAEHSFAAVMHFASLIEVAESVASPLKYYQNNVGGTLNLLAAMLQAGVKNIIFSSSAAVYGEPKEKLISETHALHPINPYGRSKLMIEEIIQDCARSGGLNYAILRYFNAAGADPDGQLCENHQPESHLIPLLLQVAAGKRKDITVYGNHYPTADGTCIRDYIHVTDICNAHLLCLLLMQKGKKNILCNLGTGQGYSVLQVINAVRRITGHSIPIVNGAQRAGDPAVLIANPALAQQELHWQPKQSDLDTIIRHAWAVVK